MRIACVTNHYSSYLSLVPQEKWGEMIWEVQTKVSGCRSHYLLQWLFIFIILLIFHVPEIHVVQLGGSIVGIRSCHGHYLCIILPRINFFWKGGQSRTFPTNKNKQKTWSTIQLPPSAKLNNHHPRSRKWNSNSNKQTGQQHKHHHLLLPCSLTFAPRTMHHSSLNCHPIIQRGTFQHLTFNWNVECAYVSWKIMSNIEKSLLISTWITILHLCRLLQWKMEKVATKKMKLPQLQQQLQTSWLDTWRLITLVRTTHSIEDKPSHHHQQQQALVVAAAVKQQQQSKSWPLWTRHSMTPRPKRTDSIWNRLASFTVVSQRRTERRDRAIWCQCLAEKSH